MPHAYRQETVVTLQPFRVFPAARHPTIFGIACRVTQVLWFQVFDTFLGHWVNPKSLLENYFSSYREIGDTPLPPRILLANRLWGTEKYIRVEKTDTSTLIDRPEVNDGSIWRQRSGLVTQIVNASSSLFKGLCWFKLVQRNMRHYVNEVLDIRTHRQWSRQIHIIFHRKCRLNPQYQLPCKCVSLSWLFKSTEGATFARELYLSILW